MKTGRNDLCPCGSGLKYKKCCADKHDASEHQRVMGELGELLKGKSFGSLDEANAFLRQHNQHRNQAPSDDFHGLSPEQMHRFLHFPFDTPHLIAFPSSLDSHLQAPILSLFKLLAEGIGDDGLKATATGNLPRNFCRESAQSYYSEEEYSPEKVVRTSYSSRCLNRFARYFGLVEIERPGNDRYSAEFKVRKLPLLDQVVQFHL